MYKCVISCTRFHFSNSFTLLVSSTSTTEASPPDRLIRTQGYGAHVSTPSVSRYTLTPLTTRRAPMLSVHVHKGNYTDVLTKVDETVLNPKYTHLDDSESLVRTFRGIHPAVRRLSRNGFSHPFHRAFPKRTAPPPTAYLRPAGNKCLSLTSTQDGRAS